MKLDDLGWKLATGSFAILCAMVVFIHNGDSARLANLEKQMVVLTASVHDAATNAALAAAEARATAAEAKLAAAAATAAARAVGP